MHYIEDSISLAYEGIPNNRPIFFCVSVGKHDKNEMISNASLFDKMITNQAKKIIQTKSNLTREAPIWRKFILKKHIDLICSI